MINFLSFIFSKLKHSEPAKSANPYFKRLKMRNYFRDN